MENNQTEAIDNRHFISFVKSFKRLLKNTYGIDMKDCISTDEVQSSYDDKYTEQEIVDFIGEKYDLKRIV